MTVLENGLDDRYITGPELQDTFVDKSTGLPLAFGQIFFYKDTSHTTAKPVYQLSYDTGTQLYSYVALSDPLTLSGVGTFDDGNGNNIPIYYYPYDSFGNLELYYVTAYDSNNLLQFTRNAWPYPNVNTSEASTINDAIGLTNMLTNPQFAVVNFIADETLSIAYTSGTTVIGIAPGWNLNITASGSGTLTIEQTPVAGNSAYPFNPPFVLTIDPGININSGGLTLTQRLSNNPDWAASQTSSISGFVSGSVMLGPGTIIAMNYVASAGNASQVIIPQITNTTGGRAQFNETVELLIAANPQTGLVGYDTIELILSNTAISEIGNVQIIPLRTNIEISSFDQTPVNRQIDQMFNYYQSQLNYKPISSYLTAWDFPLNPAQASGHAIAAKALGAKTSYYAWDQTIVYQSVTNSVTVSQSAGGYLTLTATADTQIALVQYLSAAEAVAVLSTHLSASFLGATDQTDGIKSTISLWYTVGATLPDLKTPNFKSIVNTLDANGFPTVLNNAGASGWIQIFREGVGSTQDVGSLLGNATFTLEESPLSTAGQYLHSFNGWLAENPSSNHGETFFAIVVGFGVLASGKSLIIKSIGLVPGDIPTIPAPQSVAEVLADCRAYYESSFQIGTTPAQNVGLNTGEFLSSQVKGSNTASNFVGCITYKVPKTQTTTVTIYSPGAVDDQVYNESGSISCAVTALVNVSKNNFSLMCSTANPSAAGNLLGAHWSADARLGLA